MSKGAELAEAARTLIGTPFLPGGRDPASGLDCFGVLHAALLAIGIAPALPANYRLRRIALPPLDPWLAANRLVRAHGPLAVGDILLLRCGPAQPHCVIITASGFVHAHAGLHRTVETPGPPSSPPLGAILCHARLGGE